MDSVERGDGEEKEASESGGHVRLRRSIRALHFVAGWNGARQEAIGSRGQKAELLPNRWNASALRYRSNQGKSSVNWKRALTVIVAVLRGVGVWIARHQTLLAVPVVILGWLVVHQHNLERDLEAKRLDTQVQYLIEAYRRLEKAAGRDPRGDFIYETCQENLQHAQDVEGAIGDIQLFGTPQQVELAKGVAASLAGDGRQTVNLTPLLQCLRRDLRQKLLLHPLADEPPVQLRMPRDNPRAGALPPAQEP